LCGECKKEEAKMSKCIWTEQYQGEVWETACGHAFFFDSGDIDENEFSFCPFCGLTIEAIHVKDETEKEG
jgi:hypothetical protein